MTNAMRKLWTDGWTGWTRGNFQNRDFLKNLKPNVAYIPDQLRQVTLCHVENDRVPRLFLYLETGQQCHYGLAQTKGDRIQKDRELDRGLYHQL